MFAYNFISELFRICALICRNLPCAQNFVATRLLYYRSNHQRCSMKKDVLRNFAKFTGKHLCQSLFFKKETLAQVFSVNFAKFLRTPFLQNTSGRLLLILLLYYGHMSATDIRITYRKDDKCIMQPISCESRLYTLVRKRNLVSDGVTIILTYR